jgi:hypothetical protein
VFVSITHPLHGTGQIPDLTPKAGTLMAHPTITARNERKESPMNTNTTLCKGSWIQVNKRWAARAGILLLLLLLALPCAAQAQFTYTVSGGKITITGYTGPGGALTIPSAIASLPVTSLANMAFYNCTSLTSVTIPDSVTNLQGDTFLECTHLTEIVVDTLNPVYTSVAGVVFDKSQTTLVMCPAGRAGGYTIPNSVTSIEGEAFKACGLTSVVIPDTVTSIGVYVFANCSSLTNATISNSFTSIGTGMFYGCSNLPCVTIPNRVTTIGSQAFAKCTSLISVTIPSSVTDIQDTAFWNCSSLTSVYFQGNAPSLTLDAFLGANNATVYYLPGTTGWATTFGGRPTVLWDPPVIRTSPQTQTAEAGSAADLRVQASGSSPLFCVWYLNYTNLLSCSTNRGLALTSVQFSQSGAYTVVVSNALGAVTSAPAMLNVIAAVEHRPVPGVKVTGETGSLLTVDSADSLAGRIAPLLAEIGPHRLEDLGQDRRGSVVVEIDHYVIRSLSPKSKVGERSGVGPEADRKSKV